MGLALRYADMIVPVFTHYTMSGRYGTSHHLWLKDRSAYVAYRRSGRLRQAGLLVIPALLLLAFRRTRWAAVPLLAAVLLWGVWTMFQDSVRELPPAPLQYLTVSCIGFLSAACAATLATLLSQRIHGAVIVIFSTLGGAILAFLICGWTRWNHYFPVGNEAWEMLFDPIISTVLASEAAFAFSFLHLAGRYFAVRRTDSA